MVEDSTLVRDRLVPMLAAFSGVRVVAFAESPSQAIAWLRRNRCDLVLIDLRLRAGSGLGLLDLLERCPGLRSATLLRVVLTNDAGPAIRRRCAALGAAAVFDKSNELDALFDFLRRGRVTVH